MNERTATPAPSPAFVSEEPGANDRLGFLVFVVIVVAVLGFVVARLANVGLPRDPER